jgi:GTP-binding protein
MKIVSAQFLRAAQEKKDYPKGGMVEIAFAGRSNVGKSSAINGLLNRRNLVKTSKTPGHTRKLNFFLVNDLFLFVDLPGYGFARVPLEVRAQWGPMIESYLKNRKELAGVITIIDARRPPTLSDMVLIDFLKTNSIPTVVVATKSDKLTNSQLKAMELATRSEVGSDLPVIFFSAQTGQGKNELWKELKRFIEWCHPRHDAVSGSSSV